MLSPREAFAAFVRHAPGSRFVLALSGGLDSRTLLHVAATLRTSGSYALRAIHVDHRLYPQSAQWATRCRAWCDAADVALDIAVVEVRRIAELGLEAAARAARLSAFAERLDDQEVLLTAHHLEDQAETFLLRALRAPGYDGLAGMRPLRPFAKGFLARPWLGVARSSILTEAQGAGLDWIDDPSNADTAIDRNFLRHEILPRLSARWAHASKALATSARRAAELTALANREVQRLLEQFRNGTTLDLHALDLPDGSAPAVIKAWLRDLGLPNAPPAALIELQRQMRDARADRIPEVRWPGVRVRRYRAHLYADAGTDDARLMPMEWHPDQALHLPDGRGIPALPGLFVAPLRVCARQGGETLQIDAAGKHRPVRLLLQERGIPPWRRDAIPFVWQGDRLLAVGDLFLEAGFARELRARDLIWRIESAARPG